MIPALALFFASFLPGATLAQIAPDAPRVQAPRAEAPPRARPTDPRDRAFMDGGIALTPGFSANTLGQGLPRTPQAQLAPRPNLDIEARPVTPSQAPSIAPTLIHPRVPGRSTATETVPTHPDQRLLQTPAPGARLNVPLTW